MNLILLLNLSEFKYWHWTVKIGSRPLCWEQHAMYRVVLSEGTLLTYSYHVYP